MGRKERIAIIQEIQEKRKSKVFCYLTSDRPNAEVQMKKDILPIFVQQLRHLNIKSSLKIDIFMFRFKASGWLDLRTLVCRGTPIASLLSIPHKLDNRSHPHPSN